MKEAVPFFLIDPTIDLDDQERIAYAQDVFISRTIFDGGPLTLCNGSIEEGKCEICKAPTRDMPHAYKADILSFSSSFEVLPDLMKSILRTWPVQDLRLLGDIMRYEPLEVAQDIIHVYQKRHPLGMTHMYEVVNHHLPNIEPDFMRSLAQDVYFVPYRSLPRLGMYNKYTEYAAKLVVGRVAADLQLSPQTRRRLSSFHFEEQWIAFEVEHIPLFTEHPEWNVDWIVAWDAYMHEMKRQEQEDRENYLGNL
jgi:hypothetical protein